MGPAAGRLLGSHPTPPPLLAARLSEAASAAWIQLQRARHSAGSTRGRTFHSGAGRTKTRAPQGRCVQRRWTEGIEDVLRDRRAQEDAAAQAGATAGGYFAAQRRQASREVPTNDPMQWLPIEATGFDYGAAAVERGYTRCPNCGLGYRCAWDCPHPWQWREAEPEFGTFLDYRQSVVDGEEWLSRQRDAAVAAVGGLLENLPGYDWVRNSWPGLPIPLSP